MWSALLPCLVLPVYLCENMGQQGLLAVTLPAQFVPQSATSLGLATLPRVLPTLAACLHPSYWSGLMFLLYLLGSRTSIQCDFLSVLVVFCFHIVVVLLLVVRGGTVCLPTPPSWLELWIVFLIPLSDSSFLAFKNATYFWILILSPATLLNPFISFISFLVEYLGFSTYSITASANKDCFISSFPIWMPFISSSCLTAMDSTSVLC